MVEPPRTSALGTPAPVRPARPGTGRLGGGDIGRCLTRLHHDRFTEALLVEDAVRERTIARGIAHEQAILAVLEAAYGATRDLSTVPFHELTAATEAAMHDGVDLILGGRLEGPDGVLVGMPDLLVRDDAGYLAVDVKGHKVVGSSGLEASYAPLDDLLASATGAIRFRSMRRRDLLQVAHYRALLLEIGLASPRPIGGIIGTDDPLGCAWVDLEAGSRSIMEDHADFVARAEETIAWGRAHARPLVEPWLKKECDTCPWRLVCLSALEQADDPTLLRSVTGETRTMLRESGITTVSDVADLDLESGLVEGSVILQARAQTANTLLRRHGGTGGLPLPHAPIEVDLDIETFGDTTYLAGLLITDTTGTRYEPITDWTNTPRGERDLLEQLFTRFALWARPEVIVYHWTGFEIDRLAAGADRHGLGVPGWGSVSDWFEANAVDLCDWTREHLVSPRGHGLKVIAPLCGFRWRDDDPGGLQSEMWFEELLDGNDDMRHRLLEYNEDDVIAQLRVREFLRASDSGPGPGSALASVATWPLDRSPVS